LSEDQDRVAITGNLVVTRLSDGGELKPGEQPLLLDHPAVSRRHASFLRQGQQVVLKDEGSTNGSFVNRERVNGSQPLRADDVIEFGPFRLMFDGQGLVKLSRASLAALAVRHVVKDVKRAGSGATERILHDLSITVKPGTVTCVIGASGSGKSTLLNIMAGRFPHSGGSVALGSLDMHRHFDALKQDIAFLPQAETVHELLTVRQALSYAARLRLPRETTAQARDAAITEAVAAVNLSHRIDSTIASLSGGQRKRACLAVEILARPKLLFLDEATSGLDEVTDREVMALLKRLSREGMSIVCVTHTLANLPDYCDDIVVLAAGGHLTFAGPPAKALLYFQATSLGDALAEVEQRGQEHWRQVAASHAARAPLAGAATTSPEAADTKGRGPGLRDVFYQYWVLMQRNLRLLLADRRSLLLAAVQSVVVGGLLGYAFSKFGDAPARVAAERAALLLMGITALWMGCNSASKDIVGERAIYLRERDVNLSTGSFVLAKFTVTLGFAIVQICVLLGVAALLIDTLPGGIFKQAGPLLAAGGCGVALGLLISAICNTRDQAAIVVPMAVAPQLILGGGLSPHLPAPAQHLAEWAVSAYHVRLWMEKLATPGADIGWHLPVLAVQMLVLLGLAGGVTWFRNRR
jgi:ABC-type multidrug transport system ATPase subunit